ncbi:MAG: EpsD family peptidyl-prolyl cis-trans isomerase, partial [Candidatus Methylumidiphilus sp.]
MNLDEADEETMPSAERPMIARPTTVRPVWPATPWLVAAMCAALLGGCESGTDKAAQSQVAAKVDDVEITIHQVNSQLARSGISGDAAVKAASKSILDALIDQELLVQQAQRKKLDRDPAVMQAIEDAKRQILSQAYLERMVYSRSSPTPEEAKDFYAKHPELFAKRKAYKLHVFAIPKDTLNDSLKSALDNAKVPGDVVSALKGRGIEFKEDEVKWMAEQAPMEILPAMAKMKVGDIISMEKGAGATLMMLESAVDSPVGEAQAQPVIEKYILNSRNKALLDDKLKQLRKGEQITYVGQFAENQPAAAAPAQGSNNAPQTPPPEM